MLEKIIWILKFAIRNIEKTEALSPNNSSQLLCAKLCRTRSKFSAPNMGNINHPLAVQRDKNNPIRSCITRKFKCYPAHKHLIAFLKKINFTSICCGT